MSSSKRILSGVFWTTLSSVINAGFAFFSVPILLLHYGKAEYGLIGLAFSVNVYLRLMDMGFSSANVKYFSAWLAKKDFQQVSKLFQSSLVFYGVIGIINAIILLIISLNSKQIFSLSDYQADVLNNMFYVLMISAFFGWISSLLDQFLRANEIIGWEQRLLVFAKILQVIILILTVKFNFSIKLYFALTTLSALIIIPFTIVRIKSFDYHVSFIPKYFHNVFKEVLPYSLSIFSFSIFQFSAVYLRPLILSVGAGIESVADFRILEGFANLIMLTSSSFTGVMLPIATKAIVLGNKENQHKLAYDGTKYISIFLALVCFGFFLISSEVIQIYVGKNYLYLVPWLNCWVFTLLLGHNGALSSLVLSGNNMKPIVYISAFSTVTSLTLAWFLVPKFAVGGVIIGYLYYVISQLSFYYIYYYKKVLKLNAGALLLKSFLIPVSIIGLCGGLTYGIKNIIVIQNNYFSILLSGIIFLLVSIPTIYFIVFNEQDKIFIGKLFKKKGQLANS